MADADVVIGSVAVFTRDVETVSGLPSIVSNSPSKSNVIAIALASASVAAAVANEDDNATSGDGAGRSTPSGLAELYKRGMYPFTFFLARNQQKYLLNLEISISIKNI
jgi:hypothetical protein